MELPDVAEFRRVLMKLSRAIKAARKGTILEGTAPGREDAQEQLERLGEWMALLTLVVREGDSVLEGLRPSTHLAIRPYLKDVPLLLAQADVVADQALLFYGGALLDFKNKDDQ